MVATYRDARLKIKRANHHIADLKRTIGVLKESRSSAVLVNAETGNQEVIYMLDFPKHADDIALIAGDAIHNLRAALDFAWVATLKRLVSRAKLKHAKFPVYRSLKDLKGALKGIHIHARSNAPIFNLIVSDIQPYRTGKYGGIVYILHKLDITDKHLVLLGIHPLAGISGIVVEDDDGVIHGSAPPINAVPPYIIPFGRNIRIKNEGELSFDITLRETGFYDFLEITEVLSKFSNAVEHFVQLMENL